jgi:hypothetical protein
MMTDASISLQRQELKSIVQGIVEAYDIMRMQAVPQKMVVVS